MYRFFETIKIENGEVLNLDYHLQRMMRTSLDYGLDHNVVKEATINLSKMPFENSYHSRCKLSYDNSGYNFDFSELVSRRVTSLKIVLDDSVSYSHKFCDRRNINALFDKREDCDDVLIVKNGQLTDTSIANILLFDGSSWVTPDSPLLNGTCRQRLIDEGRIEVRQILLSDLKSYSSIMLINALRDFDETEVLNIASSVK
ncbi:MAG: aminotransferase class IV [Bacteroidales bacterium]|nr:aminotransferase class IV [Bacteroidales bacterium]